MLLVTKIIIETILIQCPSLLFVKMADTWIIQKQHGSKVILTCHNIAAILDIIENLI